jgi:hypothetical protein
MHIKVEPKLRTGLAMMKYTVNHPEEFIDNTKLKAHGNMFGYASH